jgi:2-formylbenzoate dehydrogenase
VADPGHGSAAAPAQPVAAVGDGDWRLLIGGRLRAAASTRTYASVDPSTEEPLATVPDASPDDVAAAVDAAQHAFDSWRRLPVRERARTVRRLVPLLAEHAADLAALDACDAGITITAARNDVRWAIDLIDVLCDGAMELRGETIPASADNLHYTLPQPYGVVARIIPFNHPLFFAATKIAAPLIAGNAVILKAPDQTPLSPLRLGELAREVFPPGVLNILTGTGPVAGDALVRHPAVRRIAFIGSEPTGRAIQRAAAETGVKTVSLELGGKNALIALPDADPEAVAAGAVAGMNFIGTQGQSCGSTSRLLVHEDIASAVLEAVRARVEHIRVGAPLDPQTDMGPLITRAHLERVTKHIDGARAAGASLLTGGSRPAGLARGWYLAPTVLTDVTPDLDIASEEVFGPVLSVLTWRHEDEAVRIANSVDYGLTASIWTNEIRAAHRLARDMEAGYVWINGSARHFWGTPFGGVKASGVGREEGLDELRGFTQTKAVHVML